MITKDNHCYIFGGGPSLRDFDWESFEHQLPKGHYVFAINRAFEKLLNADLLYFTDKSFWDRYRGRMLNHEAYMILRGVIPEDYDNCKLRTHKDDKKVHIIKLTQESGIVTAPGCAAHGCNSAYAAMNVAVSEFGFKTIHLLGVDLGAGPNGESHWHDGYGKAPTSKAVYARMFESFRNAAPVLKKMGVDVYNWSPTSPLTEVFPSYERDANRI